MGECYFVIDSGKILLQGWGWASFKVEVGELRETGDEEYIVRIGEDFVFALCAE